MVSISVPCSNTAAAAALHPRRNGAALSFHRSSKPVASLSLGSTFSGIQWPSKKGASLTKVQAQLSEVVAKESANHSPLVVDDTQSEVKTESTKNRIPDAASFSEFMDQVSHLVKLVDSRDIMELKLKQLDCEIEIRKKEALPQPTPPAPVMMMQSPYQHAMPPPPPPPPASASPAPVSAAAPTLALPPPAKAASSHPPFKCPMAGTFYRSPAPGEPPFVKVGDKVQKGQVVCIIEAMKLMNEIEADKSGTITEVLADDGKPVSVDTPLFVIAP